jgi:hypothetical protein
MPAEFKSSLLFIQEMQAVIADLQAKHAQQQASDPTYWQRDEAAQQALKQPPAHGPMHYIAGAAKAVVASVTADSPMSERRLAICKGCDQWSNNRCKQCGCFTGLKVRLPSERCPMGKWEAER